MKYFFLISGFFLCAFLGFQETKAQSPCFGKPTTAAYATGGESPYIRDVLWLTWGSTLDDLEDFPYGKPGEELENGSGSYASITIGDGKILCVQALISNCVGRIRSYAPGDFEGDSMDDLYNIGGIGEDNDLVNGIQNSVGGAEVSFTISCKAWLDGKPVRLAGLVLGDAESLNGSSEDFHVTADGEWNIVELKKNILNDENEYPGEYLVEKKTVGARQQIHFLKGNDDNTAAVSFLTFNPTAYAIANEYQVTFDVTLKGGSLTAIALGLLTINADGGDAPESYGAPLHLFEGLSLTDDGIDVDALSPTNLNTEHYDPGALISDPSTYLGSTGPDADSEPLYSKDALGDDNYPSPSNEEDAWPDDYKRFSYKATYMPGNIIRAEIPYRGTASGYIAGWIDFNLNGQFDDDELVVVSVPASPLGTTAILEWTVPQNRVPYSTYVRLRYGPNEDEVSSPTSVATGGEVEDHRIYIFGPAITNPMLPSKGQRSQN